MKVYVLRLACIYKKLAGSWIWHMTYHYASFIKPFSISGKTSFFIIRYTNKLFTQPCQNPIFYAVGKWTYFFVNFSFKFNLGVYIYFDISFIKTWKNETYAQRCQLGCMWSTDLPTFSITLPRIYNLLWTSSTCNVLACNALIEIHPIQTWLDSIVTGLG